VGLEAITARLRRALAHLPLAPPVAYAYNPLAYARAPYEAYLQSFGSAPREVVLLGMNPGPWGMAQTGVPFGEVAAVRDWMGIRGPVAKPVPEHPKRPVTGFACPRSEASGRRLWAWARRVGGTAQSFFARFFVANYCPLMFLDQAGRNITPDKIPVKMRRPLATICDQALRDTLVYLAPRFAIGIGNYAAERMRAAADGLDLVPGRITHPSPANPRANRGWEARIMEELRQIGVEVSVMPQGGIRSKESP
jgi:single-strand selective monofunctional uracil DNA glycosylase